MKLQKHIGLFIFLSGLLLIGCGADPNDTTSIPSQDKTDQPAGTSDIQSMALKIDLEQHQGTATLKLTPDSSGQVPLEIGSLQILQVNGPQGPLEHQVQEKQLQVLLPGATMTSEISIEYRFAEMSPDQYEGLLPSGSTFTWPYYCGNLFPCHSRPDDGLTSELSLTGIPAGLTEVFPRTIQSDAPSYMLAWAVGEYSYKEIGTTTAGTKVSVWWLPGEENAVKKGTAKLEQYFDWLEQNIGPYSFGSDVGSVSVRWGAGAYGGMEHHPLWHVSSGSMGDLETHVHEAAHGWYGNGVRIRCWEDFVLSEGTTSYLTARAIEAVDGKFAGMGIWNRYHSKLSYAVRTKDRVAWPDSCGEVDILADGLFSSIPYMKGAYFFKALAKEIGTETLDQVLAQFYQQHVGTAAGMQDLLDTVHSVTGFDVQPLAQAWLRGLGIPD